MTTKTATTTSKTNTKAIAPAADKMLEKIALDHLFIETLETQNRDRLDFHDRSEEHTSELQSHHDLVCRILLENKTKSSRNDIDINYSINDTRERVNLRRIVNNIYL